MRALVTGGAGFIGSHLADRLVADGHKVVVLDDLSTGRHANIEHLLDRPGFEFTVGSVLDSDVVDRAAERCDTVFHLAAAVGVRLVVEQPLEALLTNVRGCQVVVEAVRRHGARLLVTSSSEVYGKNGSAPLGEGDDRILGSPLKSRWAYAEGKAVAEVLAHAHWRQTGLPTVIVRLFNTVGPRQTGRYGMVLPRFVDQAVRGEPLTVYGDGRQSRCFAYVGDVVDALVALVDEPAAYGRVVNLGSQEEVSIEQLAHRVIAIAGSVSKVRHVPYDEAYEEGFEDMPRRVPDTTLARQLVGFVPTVALDAIIALVVAEQRARSQVR